MPGSIKVDFEHIKMYGGIAGEPYEGREGMNVPTIYLKMIQLLIKRYVEGLGQQCREKRASNTLVFLENIEGVLGTHETALIHLQNDIRTPLKPILTLIDKLTEANVEVKTHILPGIGHVVTSAEEQVRILHLAIHFLLRRLKVKK